MKKYCIVILLLIGFIGTSLANPEESSVLLDVEKPTYLAPPKSRTELVNAANRVPQYTVSDKSEEQEFFEPEDDLSDSEAANRFYKFIDNTMINNKFNKFSSKVGDKINERF